MPRNILKDLTTDYDNQTFDTGRVLGVIIVVAYVVFTGHSVFVMGVPFNGQEFGIGIGAILTGLGACIWGDNRRPQYGMGYGGYGGYQPPVAGPNGRLKVTMPVAKMPIEPQG